MPLTEKQKQFLQTHNLWNGNLNQSDLTGKQQKDFKVFHDRWQRVTDQLARLPKEKRGGFQEILDEAEKKAEGKDFKSAYTDLAGVKRRILSEINGYADDLSLGEIDDKLNELGGAVFNIMRRFNRLTVTLPEVMRELQEEKKASDHESLTDALDFLSEFRTTEVSLRLEKEDLRKIADEVVEFLAKSDLEKVLEEIGLQLQILGKEKKMDVAPQAHKVLEIRNGLTYKEKPLTKEVLRDAYSQLADNFEEEIKAHKDLSKFQQRDPESLPSDGKFSELQTRERQGIENARLVSLLDSLISGNTLDPTDKKTEMVPPPRKFRIEDMMLDLDLPKELDVESAGTQVKQYMDRILEEERRIPNSDILFDLALKSEAEFRIMLSVQLGFPTTTKKRTEQQNTLVSRMANEMFVAVQQEFPNKTRNSCKVTTKGGMEIDVPSEFSLGEAKFENPKYLAQGSFGHVLRYAKKTEGTDPNQPKEYVVLKTLVNPQKREEMLHELQMLRHAGGGETGKGSPNVVSMKGAVVGKDSKGNDTLFMALEYAEGGDMHDMGLGMRNALTSGVLSEEARQILCQHMMGQAISGMKHVQDRNMTHQDIKPGNFLIAKDGTVKVTDFGSSQLGDEQGTVLDWKYHTTPGYEAPESYKFDENRNKVLDNRITGKVDTYSLGVMLDEFSAPDWKKPESGKDLTSKNAVTVLDKLKNSMLDKDPNKRPSLETVMQTAYITDSGDNYDPQQIQDLMVALVAYNENVVRKTTKDKVLIEQAQITIRNLNMNKQSKSIEEVQKIDQQILEEEKIIKELRQSINEVLTDQNDPFVRALEKANKELTGRGASGRRGAWIPESFRAEYEKIVKSSGLPESAPLMQALEAVDLAKNIESKMKGAKIAEQRAEKLAQNMSKFVKEVESEDEKQKVSQLGVELRKLQQALQSLTKVLEEQLVLTEN